MAAQRRLPNGLGVERERVFEMLIAIERARARRAGGFTNRRLAAAQIDDAALERVTGLQPDEAAPGPFLGKSSGCWRFSDRLAVGQ